MHITGNTLPLPSAHRKYIVPTMHQLKGSTSFPQCISSNEVHRSHNASAQRKYIVPTMHQLTGSTLFPQCITSQEVHCSRRQITRRLFLISPSLKPKMHVCLFLYTAVSSPLNRSKHFTLHPVADLFIPAPTRLV